MEAGLVGLAMAWRVEGRLNSRLLKKAGGFERSRVWKLWLCTCLKAEEGLRQDEAPSKKLKTSGGARLRDYLPAPKNAVLGAGASARVRPLLPSLPPAAVPHREHRVVFLW